VIRGIQKVAAEIHFETLLSIPKNDHIGWTRRTIASTYISLLVSSGIASNFMRCRVFVKTPLSAISGQIKFAALSF
jgi:hypothetical protein